MAITGNAVVGMTPLGQSLASVPDVTKRRGTFDGLESQGHALERATLPALENIGQDPEVQPARPTLATIPDAKLLFRCVDGLARSQERIVSNRWAIDRYTRGVRANIPFISLEKIPNQAVWVTKLPDGITRERSGQSPNKADDLLNKIENALEADPMRPAPISHLDSESAEQATALASEYLRSIMGESGINWEQKHHWALNVALTCGSAFLHFDIDPQGGGYQAYQKLAHPEATDQDLAAATAEGIEPTFVTTPDGQRIPTSDPVLRFVSADGRFVEDASEADRVWLPKPTCERVRREQVRLFPPTADIESARGCILLLWMTLQDAIAKWPDTVGKMGMSELQGLASWRPSAGQDVLVPFAMRTLGDGQSGPTLDEVGSFSPLLQRRMFYYRMYVKSTPEYPDGWDCAISGYQGGTVLGKKTMEYTVVLPKDGSTTRCRDIPVEQIRPCQDVDGGDPMGWALIHRIAGSSDAAQFSYSAYQDAVNIRLNPHVFIRSTVAVDDQDWADRGTPILLNPTDPEPNYEQLPAMPDALTMIDNLDRKMDSAAGLGETAQGLETSTSVSGVAKQITVQQAQRDLSGFLQQLNAAKTRGCRILVQIAQAEFDIPQLMQYTGEDGSVQAEWWTGENLAGIDDIGIEPGTGTTSTPEGKAQVAQYAQGQGWLAPADAAKVGLAGFARDLGLPPDPVTEAIERSVGLWLKGPPKGWIEQYQATEQARQQWAMLNAQDQQAQAKYQAALQQIAIIQAGTQSANLGMAPANAQTDLSVAQARIALQVSGVELDPASGLPIPPQPTAGPQPPAPFTPFEPRPNDTEPSVAARWMERLSRLQFSPEYTRFPAPWKQLVDAKYTQARQATAVIPQGHPASPMTPSADRPPTTPALKPGATQGVGR